MLTLVIVLHILVALFMIFVVLLQPGNKGGVNAALGGSGGETVFGGRGANTFLAKLTFVCAVIFMVTNFTLSLMSSPKGSVLEKMPASQPVEQKAQENPVQVPAAALPPAATDAPVDVPPKK